MIKIYHLVGTQVGRGREARNREKKGNGKKKREKRNGREKERKEKIIIN